VDLDVEIEKSLSMSVSQIIEEKGELYFRKQEHERLLAVLEEAPEAMVLAVGGGTPVFFDHMTVLNEWGETVFLDVGIGELANRLQQDTTRPLIQNQDDVMEFVAKHLFERRPFYSQAKRRIRGDQLTLSKLLTVLD
jgi:shikimate kinase